MSQSSFDRRLERNASARRRHLGRLLKQARRQLGYRQLWVGKALGYGDRSQAEVSRIEAGKRKIDAVELENFAHLYRVNLSHFETWDMQQKQDREKYSYAVLGEGLEDEEFQKRMAEIKSNSGRKPVPKK